MKAHWFSGILFSVVLSGCAEYQVERHLTEPDAFAAFSGRRVDSLSTISPYLKAHMRNGNLYIFDSWKSDRTSVSGHASWLNAQRDTLGNGPMALGIDSVSIFETNVLVRAGGQTALTVFAGITAAITIGCAINPKACFGSCPTFYVSDGDSLRLAAEGFSSSIAPSLESSDVDMLYRARSPGGTLSVEMRNEALETHVVRHVDILALPRKEGTRIFADDNGTFRETCSLAAPFSARGPEGDCLPPLSHMDGIERISLADGTYLAAKETIDLEFHVTPGRTYGLVIGCRQSLLPTYLLYQMYAYMGNAAGFWIAEIERRHLRKSPGGMEDLIGGIEAEVRDPGGRWGPIGGVYEHGPLATDIHLLPAGPFEDSIAAVRILMTRGAWRFDYAALAELSDTVSPIRVHPRKVLKDNVDDDEALQTLLDSTRHLVTYPGDRYTLEYVLPKEGGPYELFLESRGYYLEWIRKEWIAEENPLLFAEMFADPESALRRLAPAFKRVEPQMEECFWRSRYAKP